ncbi:glycosyltransferase [Bacillus sp. PS06]|uniref:glycosyltransferase n=1 Tax=Bacillus sp. PS06 TaxID=2764176 RepID=UPI001781C502|nr:glycosyltransferase [Bacillus sp. PS06]MBD8069402.1 glycosyltransferase [Bacillus sp. PS06]
MINQSVQAIVVTFNRKNDLLICIDALIKQSKELDQIIIIDNASSDGTQELLMENDYLNNKKINYIRLERNAGGAGGFYEGISEALKGDFEYVWLMDDDGIPATDSLEKLVQVSNEKSLDIAGPVVIDITNNENLSFGLGEKFTNIKELNSFKDDKIIPNLLNPFNGTLISKKVIDSIGNIKKEMFIWGDEVEYIERAKYNGFKVGTVIDAKHFHPKNKGTFKNLFNGLIGKVMVKPEEKEMIFYRNLGYINSIYGKRNVHFKTLLKYSVYILFYRKFNLKLLKEFYSYYNDGYKNLYKLPSKF